MTLALVQTKPRVRVPAGTRSLEPAKTPTGARMLDYFGPGAQIAMIPNGMLLAVQADHLSETIKVADLRQASRPQR